MTGHPLSKAARQHRVAELLQRHAVRSQTELAELLVAEGVLVTQATLSRDLVELDAVKVRDPQGALIYALPGSEPMVTEQPAAEQRLHRLCQELLLGADPSGNLVVLRVPPGAAQFLASAIDRSEWEAVLGTIAGDDTVLVVVRDGVPAAEVAETFLGWATPA